MISPMISRRHLMLAGGAALGGCGIIPKVNDPVPLYTLSAVTQFDRSLPKVDWQLVIGTPVASADLDTTRIALTRSPGVVEYFAKGAWADSPSIWRRPAPRPKQSSSGSRRRR